MTDKEILPNFNGKCLSIKIKDSDYSHDLSDPSFEYQGGRLFIKGVVPKGATDSGWSNNQLGYVAWDQVINYLVFDSIESYQSAVKVSDDFENIKDKEN